MHLCHENSFNLTSLSGLKKKTTFKDYTVLTLRDVSKNEKNKIINFEDFKPIF